jgi:outer membrane receptor protein involved in Fe transport
MPAARPLLDSDESLPGHGPRSAFWIQDEWDIDPAWSAYVGLRREDLHTTGEGNAHARSTSMPASGARSSRPCSSPAPGWRNKGDQFRFAVSRTYKAPNIIQLMPRRYTVDNNNSATNPDQQGNPKLRPELALGADLAWEHYVGKDDMLSVSAFPSASATSRWTACSSRTACGSSCRTIGQRDRPRLEFEAKSTRGALAGA